jgi:excisionase family DNA binding protein
MSSNIKVQRICQHCGNEFTAKTTVTQYCSDVCSKRAYKARVRAAKVEGSNILTQSIKTKPIEDLKIKAFLSVSETCQLLGISRRTIYRMLERGELFAGKAGTRTIIRRSNLDQLFVQPLSVKLQPESELEPLQYDISDCYNLNEVQNKYGISEKALHDLIKRNRIQKIKKGWFAYVPKRVIDNLLS